MCLRKLLFILRTVKHWNKGLKMCHVHLWRFSRKDGIEPQANGSDLTANPALSWSLGQKPPSNLHDTVILSDSLYTNTARRLRILCIKETKCQNSSKPNREYPQPILQSVIFQFNTNCLFCDRVTEPQGNSFWCQCNIYSSSSLYFS